MQIKSAFKIKLTRCFLMKPTASVAKYVSEKITAHIANLAAIKYYTTILILCFCCAACNEIGCYKIKSVHELNKNLWLIEYRTTLKKQKPIKKDISFNHQSLESLSPNHQDLTSFSGNIFSKEQNNFIFSSRMLRVGDSICFREAK
jgi:hypothetical protein